MNILMISSEFPPVVGGIASHVDELSRAIQKQGNHVTVMSRLTNNAPPDEFNEQGVHIFRFILPGARILYESILRRHILALISKKKYNIIHVHGMRPLHAIRNIDIPICFTNHTSGFLKRLDASVRKKRSTLRRINHTDLILAPSKELVESAVSIGYRKPCIYIPNAIDIDKFSPGKSILRSKLDIPDNAFVVILARRLVNKNGVLYFARAIADIDDSNCHFIIAGDGSERAQFESILKHGKCWARVHMLGSIPNDQMPDVYRAGDLSVLPSLMEATSIAGLEAMGCGLSLIGTNVGGIPEIIQDNINGYLVPPKSSGAIKEKICVLSQLRQISKKMGEAGRVRACEFFSWPVIAKQTLLAYERILS
ncbi:MAG: glycosyltransferase [Candidatus Dadabacteria bacterium]|nr:glycosyltransferase [Candidatus Dadabacteria bacterium]NIW45244.1 glycosyltransferase [Gammaproteobacteria bacterium]